MDPVSDWLKFQFFCGKMLHNRAHDDRGVSCKVQSLRYVPLSSSCDMLQGQMLHKFHVARVKKCQRTREDVSLQHVPETRQGNFFKSVTTLRFGPCYTTLQHVPSDIQFCPRYILQQQVPAPCPLV